MRIPFSKLPIAIQKLLKVDYKFNKQEVKVEPTVDFKCPTNWHDANIMRLVVYNQTTGEHKCQTSGYYDSYVNFTKEEAAMYHGKLQTTIPDATIWIFLLESYPKGCTVYCHPTALAAAIETKIPDLTLQQKLVLQLTRQLISSYRLEEARRYKISKVVWEETKQSLITLGYMRANGSLTIEGKNVAQQFNINPWEV